MYTYTQLKNYRLYKDVLHSEWLLENWKWLFSVLELNARYDWRVVAPHTQHSLFQLLIFCTYTNKLKTIGHIWTFSTEWLFYYLTHSLWGLELHERSEWRVMAPDMHRSFPDATLCAYIASLYIHVHCYLMWNYTTTKLMYLKTTYYIPNNGFSANEQTLSKLFLSGLCLNFKSLAGYSWTNQNNRENTENISLISDVSCDFPLLSCLVQKSILLNFWN